MYEIGSVIFSSLMEDAVVVTDPDDNTTPTLPKIDGLSCEFSNAASYDFLVVDKTVATGTKILVDFAFSTKATVSNGNYAIVEFEKKVKGDHTTCTIISPTSGANCD
jgi:hypothetical protein